MKIINKVKSKSFELNSLIVFALFFISNISNYVFQIVMGRLLSVDDYGIVNTLFSYSNILTVTSSVVTLFAGKLSAQMTVASVGDAYKIIRKRLLKLTIVISSIIFVVGSAVGIILSRTWDIDYYMIIGIVVASMAIQIPAVSRGVIQGKELFVPFGIQNIILSLAKLLLSVAFAILGFGVLGVEAGFALANILAFYYAILVINKERNDRTTLKEEYLSVENIAKSVSIKRVFTGDFLIYMCSMIIANGDLLVVRGLVDGDTAGQYSAATNLVRIAFYISTAIVSTMFPMAVRKKNEGESPVNLLLKSVVYGGGCAILIVVGLLIVGKPFITFMFGNRYSGAFEYILTAGFYIVPASILTICSNYYIALGKHKFFTITFAIGALIAIAWMALVESIKLLFVGIGLIIFVVSIIDVLHSVRMENRIKEEE